MTRAEIAYTRLKHSNQEEIERFAQKVLLLINPKFESEEEGGIAYQILLEFAKTADLTAEEMLTAIRMAMNKQLFVEDNDKSIPVKVFREIDLIKLSEIQYAYKELKRVNHEHQKAKERIILALEPPKQIFDKEKEQIDLEYFKQLQEDLQQGNTDYSAFIFYDRLEDKINLSNEDKKRLFAYEKKKYELELKEQAKTNYLKRNVYKEFMQSFEKGYKEVIINRSKAIAVCEYLKQFKELPFEDFYAKTK